MIKKLSIEIHDNLRGWLTAGEVSFHTPDEVSFEYDVDYASKFLDNKSGRSVSICFPVGLDIYEGPITGFLIDLIPQGPQLKRLMGQHRIKRDSDYFEILKKCPLAPPGNIRIAEPWKEIEKERNSYSHKGFTRDEIIENENNFLDYMMEHGAPVGGSSGVAGGAPKFLLRQDRKGYFHADGWLDDSLTETAYLVKFPFTDSTNSLEILRSEKIFYDQMQSLPVDTFGPIELHRDVLFIPRFDRRKKINGQGLNYFGLESFYSAHNIIIHGTALTHEKNLEMLYKHSSEAAEDIIEYFKRTLVNTFFSNPDNHGRNSSLIKTDDTTRLSPIYDVAPMQFFNGDHIVELTRWQTDHKDMSDVAQWISDYFEINIESIQAQCNDLYLRLAEIHKDFATLGIPDGFVRRGKKHRELTLSNLKKIMDI